MEIINEEFRILSIKNFFNPDQKEKEWMKVMVDLNKEIYHKPVATKLGPYNWSVVDGEVSLFDNLYQKYLECCFDIFGKFVVSPENVSICYSYCGNKEDMGERIPHWWHDHFLTSSINSVYYLEVFEDGITFAKDVNNDYIMKHFLEHGKMPDTTKTFDYLPENGELIIFPPDLLHAAQPNKSLDYRYSLNMEIRSDNRSKELFDRVF